MDNINRLYAEIAELEEIDTEEARERIKEIEKLLEEPEEKKTLAEEFTEQNGLEVEINQAYIDNVGEEYATADNVEEAYQGQWKDDEEFVQDLCESCGDIPKDLPSYIHIDWEATARDIMMDYFESNGYYYFRNL